MTIKKLRNKINRQILNSSKYRITNQRTLLLNILQKEGGHLSAGELYWRASQKQPRLSLSTIYRNLNLFKKLGLVSEQHFTEEHHHYEVKSGAEHHHLLCLGCDRVIEFDCPVSFLQEEISQKHGFKITGIEFRITGLCPECQGKG